MAGGRWLQFFLLCLALFVAGCGGGSGTSGTGPTTLRISPATVTVPAGGEQLFTAFVGGTVRAVVWSVDGDASHGTVSQSGDYTASGSPGTYHVTVAVKGDPSISATATVTVSPGVTIQIDVSGGVPPIIPRSKYQFTATVTGASNTQVEWSIDGSSQLIDATGTFTPLAPGLYHVLARSVADPTKTNNYTVTVVADVNVRLKIEGKDDIVLDLDPVAAPLTAANFVSLVNKKFYDGIIFHRYEADFVIQGGDPLTLTLPLDDPSIGSGGPGYTIPFEDTGLLHDKYALAMAHAGSKDSAGSQFYITLQAHHELDGNYAVYGKVLSGFAVVDALRKGDKIVSARTEVP